MQKLLKITQQTVWQIVVKAVTTVSGFIILGIVSRTYGESGTGSFTLALTYLAFFYILADFGFNAHVLGKLPEKQGQLEWRKLLGVRILWGIFLMVLSSLLVLALPASFPVSFKLASIFGSLIILFYALNISAQALFQVKHRYDLDIPPTVLGTVASVLIVFWLAASGLPVYVLILGYIIAWFIHSAGSLFLLSKVFKFFLPIFDKQYAINLFKTTWPIAGTLFLNVIYFRVDAFVISSVKGVSDAGIYNVAYQVFQSILVIPTFIMNSFYPMMLVSFRDNLRQFIKQIKNAGFLLFTFSLIISLITYRLSSYIVELITGSGFAGAVNSLQILSVGFPAYFLSALLMWVMMTKKIYKELLVVYGLGLVFNITANLILIPRYSYIGASWVTVISEYLILIMQVIVLKSEVRS